tara:strand:+ start:280 stop:450 length:171 start_codon:yes stop_codon:yes gene_type:complete
MKNDQRTVHLIIVEGEPLKLIQVLDKQSALTYVDEFREGNIACDYVSFDINLKSSN